MLDRSLTTPFCF